jgi:hypothetical protein
LISQTGAIKKQVLLILQYCTCNSASSQLLK